MYLSCFKAKWPNLKLKTGAKQRLGYLRIAFARPVKLISTFFSENKFIELLTFREAIQAFDIKSSLVLKYNDYNTTMYPTG
jgi:hypothetical protein